MERLREQRKKAKLLQAELAARLNVTQATLSRWESGKATPDADHLRAAAEILHTSTDYLTGRTDDPQVPAPADGASFGGMLRGLRGAQHVTRADLCAELGFSPEELEAWESGRELPDTHTQRLISDYFGVSLPFLQGSQKDPGGQDDSRQDSGTPFIAALMRKKGAMLTKENLNQIAAYIQGIADANTAGGDGSDE